MNDQAHGKGERKGPGADYSHQDGRSAKRQRTARVAAESGGQVLEDQPDPPGYLEAEDTRADSSVKDCQKDIDEDEESQQGAKRLFQPGRKHERVSGRGVAKSTSREYAIGPCMPEMA
jgi:hypothetical protein